MIAAVTPRGQRVGFCQSLEVGRRHVVEQDVEVQRKQGAETILQVRLERSLVRQQLIESLVETRVVHHRRINAQQIFERCASIPVLGDVQFAGWFAQSRDDQDRRDLRPRHDLSTFRHHGRAELVEPECTPQRPPDPDVAERAAALRVHFAEPHALWFDRLFFSEQARLHRAFAQEVLGECRRLGASRCIKFTEVGDDFLPDLGSSAYRPHQHPVGQLLAVLANRRVA